jgi:hypothetical protein
MALTVFYQVKRLLDLGCALRNTVFPGYGVGSSSCKSQARAQRIEHAVEEQATQITRRFWAKTVTMLGDPVSLKVWPDLRTPLAEISHGGCLSQRSSCG